MSGEPGNPRVGTKDFLSVLDVSSAELVSLLDLAARLKRDRGLGAAAPTATALSGRHVALIFDKPSLRTRATFEIAVQELGAHALHVPSSSIDGQREPLEDIARNMERWVHGIVLRTFAQAKALAIGKAASRLHVINALTDEEHPCQALADFLTLREQWGTWQGKTLAYVGDGNNVAVSLAHAAAMLGVTFRIASPSGYYMPAAAVTAARAVATGGATLTQVEDPREAAQGADAVYTDVWTSMGQEAEAMERRRLFAPYQVNAALMAAAAPGARFLHCLPAHRGEEVTAEVFESPASVVFDQAENRLHTQKALLLMLLG
jgi:ornithine carbamoyltransferase